MNGYLVLWLVIAWCVLSVPLAFIVAYLCFGREQRGDDDEPSGAIDLTDMHWVDLVNLPPGLYVTSRPLDAMAGVYAVHLEAGERLYVPEALYAR